MNRILAVPSLAVLALSTIIGCTAESTSSTLDGEGGEKVGQVGQDLYVSSSAIWTQMNVLTCWIDDGFDTEKAWVKDAIYRTWMANSAMGLPQLEQRPALRRHARDVLRRRERRRQGGRDRRQRRERRRSPRERLDVGSTPAHWITGSFYGELGTFFADVNGDKKADAIAVNEDGIYPLLSDGTKFVFNYRSWTSGQAFYGQHGTYFADVNGDGKADAIAVNDDGIYPLLSNGSAFLFNYINWTNYPFYGTR